MDLRQLEMVMALAETGSFTAAAKRLLVAQPSVTNQVRALEEEIGYPLFDRLPRGVRLTEVGRIVVRRSRHIFQEVTEMRGDVEELAGLRRGRLSVGTIPTLITSVVPTVLRRFHEDFPGIHLTLDEGRASNLVEAVARRRLDLAIIGGGQSHEGVELETVYEQELVVILPAHDALAERSGLSLTDLRDHPFLILELGFGLRTIILNACAASGFSPKVAMETESVQAIKSLVHTGFGISIVPQATAALEVRAGLLKAVPLMSPRLRRPVQIATAHAPRLPRSVQAFRDVCHTVIAEATGHTLTQME